MDYYMELDMKVKLYNKSHNIKANSIILGWVIEEYFKDMLKDIDGEYNDILLEKFEAELKWNKIYDNYELVKFRNMNVEINKTIPYLIDVKYVEEKVDDIIKMLMFTKDEVRHIKAKIDYKTKENMDNSLKDLKSWIEYDKYLESIGKEQDDL